MKLEYAGNWSFSSLMVYEACAYRFKLAKIDRLPELPRPADNPMERGNRIHDHLERFVDGREISLELIEARAIKMFEPALVHLRELYSLNMAHTEDDWIFDRDWNDTTKDDKTKYLWAKLDFGVKNKVEAEVIVGDYKSGKSGYKTIEHTQQLQLYAAIAALKYDWVETIKCELWYVDEGHVKAFETTREAALRFVGRFDARAQRIYQDRLFKPNPNKETCRYCPYSRGKGTGACAVAAA